MTNGADAITEGLPRYLVGIDLGTTNCAVAYVDTAVRKWTVHDFPIPQLTAPATVESRPTLPSFHYEPADSEFPAGALDLPWAHASPPPGTPSRGTGVPPMRSTPSPGTPGEGQGEGSSSPNPEPRTPNPAYIVGLFARDHGATVPGRLVVSAKSWLSHSGVDRTAALLPWHGVPDVTQLSPVQVSARYLAHIRAAWDHQFPEHRLAEQDVVLTVPASFDEVARELTVEAARQAGLSRLVLVEEPQAAFYAWINAQGAMWQRRVKPGQKILVCDIGGGTTDFTLIRVRPAAKGKVLFHRIAVGEHLILGGDNLDLALAHHLEKRVSPDAKLDPRQWGTLVRAARHIKETLLGPDAPEKMTASISRGGSRLIGSSIQLEVTRDEVEQILVEGFLPRVALTDRPASRRSGFQEFGLPYAPDPAITRYLASFLTTHRHAGEDIVASSTGILPVSEAQDVGEAGPADPKGTQHGRDGRATTEPPATSTSGMGAPPMRPSPSPGTPGEGRGEGPIQNHRSRIQNGTNPQSAIPNPQSTDSARPDLILFNGGFFESPILRQRLLDVLTSWFATTPAPAPSKRRTKPKPWSPTVLPNDRLDLAVARGAAYYGMVRRGHGVRITGGLAHSYYIGVETTDPNAPPHAICLLPAGVEEGQPIDLADRTFNLLIRQPVEFPLYVSSTRTTDRPGTLLAVDPEQLTPLPPIRTVLQSGRKAAAETILVRLHAQLTPIGTLELWCAETTGDRRWRLQFDVRSAATRADYEQHAGAGESQGVIDEQVLTHCRELIRASFTRTPDGTADRPEGLVKRLEQATNMTRLEWPPTLMRGFWETLMEVEAGRRLSVEHEARWLSLTGFCLRPGYGLAVDDWRVAQVWRLFSAKVVHAKNELCRAEWWILWRRLAGGLTQGQQQTLAEPLISAWRNYARKLEAGTRAAPFGPHEAAETWRLLGSLELLKPDTKAELGGILLSILPREKTTAVRDACLFAMGRLGSRVPVYGPLDSLLTPDVVESWALPLIEGHGSDERAAFTVVQLTRRTDDRYRDVSDALREQVLYWLSAQPGVPPHYPHLVRAGGQLQEQEQRAAFGESLPRGLRIG